MKNNNSFEAITITCICAIIVTLSDGCSKNTYDDTLPSVEFLSVTPTGVGGDSVVVSGKVLSQGLSSIGYVGFAYSTQSSFSILSNQVLAGTSNSLFSAKVIAYPESTYYFKAFATNSYGYSASSVFKYAATLGNGNSAPCFINNNSDIDNGSSYTFININSGTNYATFGTFGVEADNGAYEMINIFFNGTPVSGIYTTQSNLSAFNNDPNQFDVAMEINSNTVNSGSKVYVTVNSNKTTTVSFCSVEYQAYGNQYASGKITF